MTQFLEATMLVCFGCSWPLSVYKNIKAKSARSMSLPFILLIIVGYIAGISAKIISHSINYVLIVYLLNLLIVSANLVVYFINKQYDKQNSKSEEKSMENTNTCAKNKTLSLTDAMQKEICEYRELNPIAKKRSTVFIGEKTRDSALTELSCSMDMSAPVYDRSVVGLHIMQTPALLEQCVYDLMPDKVFLCLGAEELKAPDSNPAEMIENYRWALYTLHNHSDAKIYLIPVAESKDTPKAEIFNRLLKKLASETGCRLCRPVVSPQEPSYETDLIKVIKSCIESDHMTFDRAMRIADNNDLLRKAL